MQKLFIYIFTLIFGMTTQQLLAQQADHETISTTDTIPFTLTAYNNISIQAIINQVDTVNLMFHTAVNSLSLTEKAVERLTNFKIDQADTVTTWGGQAATNSSNYNSLQIGNFKWDSLFVTIGKNSGRLTDGKFGPNLFKDKIIEIDFDHSRLLLHSALPQMDKEYEKLNLILDNNGFMFLEGNLKIGDNLYKNKFLIHSGFGGTILLDDEFVSTHDIGSQLKTVSESELRDSYGNVLKTKKVILPSLNFGDATFVDIQIGFFEGAIARQKMSVLGGDVLKRFNMIIDTQNAHIYLKSNMLFGVEFGG